ncbi:hypothetical protein M0802_000116 [Mischocyttarus mexicanus]|nr:hypothetical protein M0802_000116 [Mischocyttarus mexicanus]
MNVGPTYRASCNFIASRNPYLSGGLISENPFRLVLSSLGRKPPQQYLQHEDHVDTNDDDDNDDEDEDENDDEDEDEDEDAVTRPAWSYDRQAQSDTLQGVPSSFLLVNSNRLALSIHDRVYRSLAPSPNSALPTPIFQQKSNQEQLFSSDYEEKMDFSLPIRTEDAVVPVSR